jgi:cytochrome c5
MKATYLLAAFLTAALPIQDNAKEADPYKAYSMQLQQTAASIAATHAAIAEAQQMTEAKIEEAKEAVKEAEQMAEKVELLERVCEVYSVPVPESLEALEAEQVADSVRVANMQKINK